MLEEGEGFGAGDGEGGADGGEGAEEEGGAEAGEDGAPLDDELEVQAGEEADVLGEAGAAPSL